MGNRIKELLKRNQAPIGCFIGIHSPSLAEIAGYSGFDFVVIDNEHGSFSWGEVEEMVRACEISGTVPIVRVSNSSPSEILKALDRGAKGIHVPQVNSGEEARHVVACGQFPPKGKRGAAYSVRAAEYGRLSGESYLNQSNEDILIAVHIETPQAVAEIEPIMKSGIDVAYIGPTDLSVSCGYASQPNHSEVSKLMDQVLAAGKRLNVNVGIQVGDRKSADDRIRWGADYIGIGLTPLLYNAFKIAAGKSS